jgi:Ca2+-transporting ATPase
VQSPLSEHDAAGRFADARARTLVACAGDQLAHLLALRSERASLFSRGLRSNRPLVVAVLLTFALQLCTLYVPWMRVAFRTSPLTAGALLACVAAASLVFLAVELEKWLMRRGRLYGTLSAFA